MADQVNPTGSLAPGLPSALMTPPAPRSAPDKVRPAKPAETQPIRPGSRPAAEALVSPELAAEQLNSHLQQTNSKLQFQVDKDTGRTIYKVVNPSSGQVLLQVPSEEVLAMARNLRAMAMEKETGASGVLMDKEG